MNEKVERMISNFQTLHLKMFPEIKDEWVKNLRSKEYEQGRERLCTGETYCCLGVLCEVRKLPHFELTNGSIGYIFNYETFEGDKVERTREGDLPFDYFKTLFLEPEVDGNTMLEFHHNLDICQTDLVHMNDDEGFTFEEIAYVIEKSL